MSHKFIITSIDEFDKNEEKRLVTGFVSKRIHGLTIPITVLVQVILRRDQEATDKGITVGAHSQGSGPGLIEHESRGCISRTGALNGTVCRY